jgi:NAD(P)-dependent dehydrogenase (short-subunit alcohol dehydrogenase family)
VKADSMNDGISGKGVLFTGASSGLGEALARHRAPVGAKLVPGARRLDVIIDHAGPTQRPSPSANRKTRTSTRSCSGRRARNTDQSGMTEGHA